MATRAQLQRDLAEAFEAQGWPYEHNVAPAILDAFEKMGAADGQALAAKVPSGYLQVNGIERQRMAAVLEQTLTGKTAESDAVAQNVTTMVVQDNRYSIRIGDHATVQGSQLNTAGNQLNITADTDKGEVLAAVGALVRGGLEEGWNDDAALDLGHVIEARDDIDLQDVREAARQAAAEAQPDQGRVSRLLEMVSAGAASGTLSHGIVAALGALF